MTQSKDRREFLKLSAAAAGTTFLVPSCASVARTYAANERLDVAVIGAGGKGFTDANGVAGENLVALCDVDDERAARSYKKFPGAKQYRDFRVLLDKEKLDAVVISTPDHTHAPAAVRAMRKGLHVYCQKPLTHTIEEARVLTELARKTGVVTSMGNQGGGMDGFRKGVEAIRAGVIGEVREVHVWTNRPGLPGKRPIWPQGFEKNEKIDPIPASLRWDLWLGPAEHRSFREGIAPFKWRGFWDFGTGALGDMACHLMNLPFMALELGYPTSVEAQHSGCNEESAPLWSVIKFEFPARGALPPVKLTWYDGGKKPPLELAPGKSRLGSGGSIIVGSKGNCYSKDNYGRFQEFLPKERFADFVAPEPTLQRGPGDNHQMKIYLEWIAACKGEGPMPLMNFDYAGPFTEAVLLGNLSVRTGERVEWDGAAMKASNNVDVERFIRKEYAYGFGIS